MLDDAPCKVEETNKLDAVQDKLHKINNMAEELCHKISNNYIKLNGCGVPMEADSRKEDPVKTHEPDGFFEHANVTMNTIIDRLMYADEKTQDMLRFSDCKQGEDKRV